MQRAWPRQMRPSAAPRPWRFLLDLGAGLAPRPEPSWDGGNHMAIKGARALPAETPSLGSGASRSLPGSGLASSLVARVPMGHRSLPLALAACPGTWHPQTTPYQAKGQPLRAMEGGQPGPMRGGSPAPRKITVTGPELRLSRGGCSWAEGAGSLTNPCLTVLGKGQRSRAGPWVRDQRCTRAGRGWGPRFCSPRVLEPCVPSRRLLARQAIGSVLKVGSSLL